MFRQLRKEAVRKCRQADKKRGGEASGIRIDRQKKEENVDCRLGQGVHRDSHRGKQDKRQPGKRKDRHLKKQSHTKKTGRQRGMHTRRQRNKETDTHPKRQAGKMTIKPV